MSVPVRPVQCVHCVITIAEVLDMFMADVGRNGKMNRKGYDTWTCTVQPG